jgi:serine/threonine-protein kinase
MDARADLYGVGAIAYWLLTGQRAFGGENAMEVILRQLQEDPPPPSERGPAGIPLWLDAVVLRCLSRNPDERPQSARELLRLLGEGDLTSHWTPDRADQWWSRRQATGGAGKIVKIE